MKYVIALIVTVVVYPLCYIAIRELLDRMGIRKGNENEEKN